jgi:transketolase
VIVAHTTKGKGVSFMENTAKWHGAVPNEAEYALAKAELKGYQP